MMDEWNRLAKYVQQLEENTFVEGRNGGFTGRSFAVGS